MSTDLVAELRTAWGRGVRPSARAANLTRTCSVPEPEVTVTPRSYGVRVDGRYVGTVYSEAVAGRFESVPDAGAGRDTYHATLDEAVAALVAAWEARS